VERRHPEKSDKVEDVAATHTVPDKGTVVVVEFDTYAAGFTVEASRWSHVLAGVAPAQSRSF